MSDGASPSGASGPPAPSRRLEDSPPASTTLSDLALALPPTLVAASAIGSSIMLAIGSVGPWATASVIGISASASGLNGWGWVSLITAISGGIAVVDPRWLSGFR